MLSSIGFDDLPAVGQAAVLPPDPNTGFRGGFVVRVISPMDGSKPLSANASDGYVVAFGSVCPHMGCVVSKVSHRMPSAGSAEGLVTRPCPCHGSTFDLAKSGLVVLGPATQNLPQLKLRVSQQDRLVIAESWLSDPDPTSETWPTESTSNGTV